MSSLLKSSLLRCLVMMSFVLCQMPFAPIFAGILARADGGHEVMISQSDACTLITLHHRSNESNVVLRGVAQVMLVSGEEQPDHQLRCSLGPANRAEESYRPLNVLEACATESECCELHRLCLEPLLVRVTKYSPPREIVREVLCRGLRETILMV